MDGDEDALKWAPRLGSGPAVLRPQPAVWAEHGGCLFMGRETCASLLFIFL